MAEEKKMEKTSKYEFGKPEQNDFYDVGVFNDNMEKVETALTEFDDSGTVDEIKSFPEMLTKLVTGNKLAVTLRNLKAGLQFVLHAGSIVNNCVTDNPNLPLSAAQGKALMDLYNVLNTKTYLALAYKGIFAGDFDDITISPGYYSVEGIDSTTNSPDNFSWGMFVQFPIYHTQLLIGGAYMACRTKTGSPEKWNNWIVAK